MPIIINSNSICKLTTSPRYSISNRKCPTAIITINLLNHSKFTTNSSNSRSITINNNNNSGSNRNSRELKSRKA